MRFVLCISSAGYEASLEARKLYQLIADEAAALHGQVRVIDESGEDYLFPAGLFVSVELPAEVENALVGAP